jgi:hypothetical protein
MTRHSEATWRAVAGALVLAAIGAALVVTVALLS